MIKYDNPNGYVELTNHFFEQLVGNVAQNCFGVTRMVSSTPYKAIKSAIRKNRVDDNGDQGVTVKSENGSLVIDLFIAVSYGVNINTIADSINNKVKYAVETATDLKVSCVNIHVDGLN